MLLEAYNAKKTYPEDVDSWVRSAMNILETQYPTPYDNLVNSIMTVSDDKENKKQKSIRKIFSITVDKNDPLCMYNKLFSTIGEERKNAVQLMCKSYKTLQDRQKDVLHSVLLSRLNENNYSTASETLNASLNYIDQVLNKEEVITVCSSLLNKALTLQAVWWKISYKAIKALLKVSDPADIEVFITLLPFLLPPTEGELQAAKIIINSPYALKSPYLSSNVKILQNAPYHKFFTVVFDSLSLNKNMPDIKQVLKTLNNVPSEKRDTVHKYISTLLLSSSLPENCSAEIASEVLDILVSYLETSTLKPVNKEATISTCIAKACGNKFPLEGFLQCLETLFIKTQVPKKPLGQLDFYIQNEISKFYLVLMNILITGTCNAKQHVAQQYVKSLNKFFDRFADNAALQIDAYLNVSTSENKFVDAQLQARCLDKIRSLLNEGILDINVCLDLNSYTVPYLLVILCSATANIRTAALDIFKILSILGNEKSGYSGFIKKILTFKDEIVLDHEQVPLMIRNIETNKEFAPVFKAITNLIQNNTAPLCLISGLMQLVSLVNNADLYSGCLKEANMLLEDIGMLSSLNSQCSKIVYYNAIKLQSNISNQIIVGNEIWKFITTCFANQHAAVNFNGVKTLLPVIILQQIDKEFVLSLKTDVQKALIDNIINVATNYQDPEILAAANYVFKKIDLDLKIVMEQLIKMRDMQSPKLTDSKKKRRINIIPTADILDTNDWKKGVTVLEFLQDKKKIRSTEVVIPILFDLLKKCLDFDEQDNVEYVKQLVLSSILHCIDKCEVQLQDTVFNMELVARCITASKNPQTHHHALLLLAQAASVVPQQVLHHVMTNFTFVGSPVLRHDDAYSFQIISKIIDSIIPLLIKSNDVKSLCNVLRVFVDVILDVPEHRRVFLYKQLLTKINPSENLHIFLLLVFEAHVLHSTQEKQKSQDASFIDNAPKRLDIAADLCREFSPDVSIVNCIKLIEYLRNLPVDKSNYQQKGDIGLFDIKKHTPKQLRHYKYTIVLFITNLLSSKEFVHHIAVLPNDEVVKLEDHYKNVIVNILTYIQATSKIADKSQNTPQAQYWKVMLHHSYDILDSINALLTPQMFLLVVRGLMEHDLLTVRRRILELLNSKLQHNNDFFSSCEENELMALLPNIIKIIRVIESSEIQSDEELIVQTALLSLKLLSKKLAQDNPEKFTQILDLVTNLIKSPRIQGNIMASLILCLAELCNTLRAHAISSLNRFMPTIIKVLKAQQLEESPDLLLLSIVTAIQKILDSLSLFLSPFLEKILVEVSMLASHFNVKDNEQKLGTFGSKLVGIKRKLGSLIPARVLIPAIESSYTTLTKKGNFKSIGLLMDILSENISNLNNQDVQTNLPELTQFFLSTLQFRVDGNASLVEANQVESHIIHALTTLILKLSETTFRPLYYKLYDWVRSEVKSERVITFYSLSHGIAHKLKSLFVLFAGYFLNNAAALLDACNVVKTEDLYFEENEKNVMLLEYVIKTLTAVFMYDSQKFVNKERFELLMQPIVDQIENTLGDDFDSRVKEVVIPCIVNFAVATADDALWKQMNYQILLKMRHNSSTIRLLALEALIETAKKLGEDFLPLLPETIPFLAELLEDEEETVEKAARKAVQDLEKVVGEPLEKYF